MNSGVPKGTSQAEAMSSSEKINPIALAIVELHESEGIRWQAGRQLLKAFKSRDSSYVVLQWKAMKQEKYYYSSYVIHKLNTPTVLLLFVSFICKLMHEW